MSIESGSTDNVVPLRKGPEEQSDVAAETLATLGLDGVELPTTATIESRSNAQREAVAAMSELLKETGFTFVTSSIQRDTNYDALRMLAQRILGALRDISASENVPLRDLFPVPVEVVVSDNAQQAHFSDMPPRGITLHVGLECAQNDLRSVLAHQRANRARGAGNDN